MSENIMCEGGNLEREMRRYIGETVTIFTTSGGHSGNGFTGVVLSVNRNVIRLITRIGTAPGYPLGNNYPSRNTCNEYESYLDQRIDNRGFSIGSVTDIPIDRIVAFVHNAV